MLFWNKICGFLIIIFISSLSCGAQVINTTKTSIHISNVQFTRSLLNLPDKLNSKQEAFLLSPLTVIPQDYYTQHFGIMCKQELALEKATKIPFRFRLGSLQQCNYLEGKK